MDVELLVFGTLIAVLTLVVGWRLSGALRALVALWRRPQATETDLVSDPETPISIEGETFVEASPIATDRLFDDAPGAVGAYVWRATFTGGGSYTYDFERGELRTVRRSFAAGLETGVFGASIGSKDVYIDPSWLCRAYDAEPLSAVTIGDHRRNVSLPLGLSQRLFDSPYLDLTTVGECRSGQLTDVLTVTMHDDRTDEFVVEGRGIPAGVRLFVSGTVHVEAGRPTIAGTEDAPLLLSATGRSGLRRQLVWAILTRTLLLAVLIGLGILFLG